MVRSRPTSPSTPPPSSCTLSLSPSSFPALKRSFHSQHCSNSSIVSSMDNRHHRFQQDPNPKPTVLNQQQQEHDLLDHHQHRNSDYKDVNEDTKNEEEEEGEAESETESKHESRIVIPAEQAPPLKLRTGSELLLHHSAAEEASRTIAEACTKLLEASRKPIESSRIPAAVAGPGHVLDASRKFDHGKEHCAFAASTSSVSSSSSSFSCASSNSTVLSSPSASSSVAAMSTLINGRQRLQRHWMEVAGKVSIPETWGREHHLQDWVRHGVVEDALRPAGLMTARTAMITECQRRRGAAISADIG